MIISTVIEQVRRKQIMMRFSIGTDDFKEIRTDKDSSGQLCFYCDKSLLIKDIIDDGAKVIVLPRPKRFGKTLNLSMLKHFFDIEHPENAELFIGLKIAEYKNIMEEWQGKYPVVSISFKDLRPDTYLSFMENLKKYIYECYQSFDYLLDSPKLKNQLKKILTRYSSGEFDNEDIPESLWYLTQALSVHHGQNTIVLLDEYDTPLQEAYVNNYFDKAIKPFRLMMGKTFKGNLYLYKGVITGITRIARESLFSGVNNLKVYDITTNRYASYFGFTEDDIKLICDPAHLDDLKSWYNGYTFGDNLTIYNPWSILNFLSSEYKLAPYWINTSSNELIQESLTADKMEGVKELIEGHSIDVEIEPFTVMDNLKGNNTAFWNLLFLSGFLTLDAEKKMRIPNQEIQYFFEKVVVEWFGKVDGKNIIQEFLNHLLKGNVDFVQYLLANMITKSFSIRDMTLPARESFYHGFLLGLVIGLEGRYVVKSNHESGKGYYDIALFPNDFAKDVGILIEVKFKQSTQKAIDQIEEQNYKQALESHGCKKILSYGFAFDGKDVAVQLI